VRPLVLLTVLLLCACGREKPNVLLITFDTTRADRIGFQSGREGVTPNLDRLASRGAWFETAIASQPLTAPSHASILTGLYPYHHGVRNNGTHTLGTDRTTLAEMLKKAGYRTQAIVSSFVLDSRFGFAQGFDGYDDDLTGGLKPNAVFKEIEASRVAEKALRWLDVQKASEEPFFLWLHFYDPHAEYDPPAEIAAKFAQDPYSGEIHYADQQLGRILEELEKQGKLADTLIVFTADHGESLGEHGEKAHGVFIYDATTRVPLLFAGPGVPRSPRVGTLARGVDIVPTIAELLDLDPAANADGASLVPVWKGEQRAERVAYSESMAPRLTFGWSELRAHRTIGARVIEAPKREAYDLRSDPGERRNLYGQDPPGLRPLMASLQKIIREDPLSSGGHGESAVDPETRGRLAALGYLTGGDSAREGPRADPKDRIRQWEQFHQAQELVRARRYDEAIPVMRAFLEQDPENAMAMMSLGGALEGAGDFNAAGEIYKRLIELDPQRQGAYFARIRLHTRVREFREAEQLSQAVMRLHPNDPEVYTTLGDVLLEEGRAGEAEPLFRKAVALDPNSTVAISGLGNALNRAGRLEDARAVLEAGRRREPESHVLTYNLAVVMERLGDLRTAFELYRRSSELQPQHSMTWNNIGSLLDRSGRRGEALEAIRRAHELDPYNVEALYNLGALTFEEGDAAAALPFLESALRLRPDLMQASAYRARALEKLNRLDQAEAAWREIAATRPAAWLNVARLEVERGDGDGARAALMNGLTRGGPRFAEVARRDPRLAQLLP
jgi:choline-sulfatase